MRKIHSILIPWNLLSILFCIFLSHKVDFHYTNEKWPVNKLPFITDFIAIIVAATVASVCNNNKKPRRNKL